MSKEKTLESAENRIMHLIRQAFLFGKSYVSPETTPLQNWLIDNKVGAEIDKAIASQPQWISVKDELPEHDQSCLLFGNEFTEPFCGWWNEVARLFYVDGVTTAPVTHWQPLPEPPEK